MIWLARGITIRGLLNLYCIERQVKAQETPNKFTLSHIATEILKR